MLLAIDTSTRLAGIALYDATRGLLAEHSWLSANRHTEELMPAIGQMLARAGVGAGDLVAVGVAIGPGSFTGLRVGLSAAKGIVLAHPSVRLIGVPTLDFAAYPHQAQPVPVIVVLQAGRGRVYWAPYAHGPAGWAAQEPYALATLLELANHVTRPMQFAGELSPADRETLTRAIGRGRAYFLPPAQGMRRAGYLAEMAWTRYQAGAFDDPATLSPLYLQGPDGAISSAHGAGGQV